MGLTQYQPYYPLNADLSFQTDLWKEYYLRFPVLVYNSLRDDTSTPDDFYLQATREDREYNPVPMNIRVDLDSVNEEENLTKHGLEEAKMITFRVLYPVCVEKGVEPKIGDMIIFEYEDPDQEWEVRTVKLPRDSYFAQFNYIFERELLCERPELGV